MDSAVAVQARPVLPEFAYLSNDDRPPSSVDFEGNFEFHSEREQFWSIFDVKWYEKLIWMLMIAYVIPLVKIISFEWLIIDHILAFY